MKPKRILHIIGRMDRAGAETMLMNLFRALNKDELIFDFLYFTNDTCDFDDEIKILGGKIYRVSNNNIFSRTFEIYKLVKSKKFHAIHSHTLFNSGFNLLALYAAKQKRRIVHSHSTSDTENTHLIGKIYQSTSKFLINNLATKYVACGYDASAFLFSKKQDVIQLPNAIDISFFNQCGLKNRDYLKKELSLDDECLIISQIGRLETVKNHEFSILIAKQLKKRNINFHMVFVGNGTLKENLLQLVINENLLDVITFLGVRNDVPKLLGGSDLMIMPSLYEGFPVVLVESQAVGVPVFVSNKVSVEVDLNVNKIFFKPLTLKLWVDAIVNIDNLSTTDDSNRIKILKNKGFNIAESLLILNKIYI